MYLMLGDEADFEQGRGQKFFVYGAIFVPPEGIKPLSDSIEAARVAAKYKATDSLKFAVKTCPEGIAKETFRDLKAKVIELAIQHRVVFCAYAILHSLASNQAHRELVTFGANTLLGKFDEFLSTDKDTFGFVIFDKIPIPHHYTYLREKFQVGLTFPDGNVKRLEKVVGLATIADGQSHLASLCDILVGSWRYCVNEPAMDVAGKAMFPKANGPNVEAEAGRQAVCPRLRLRAAPDGSARAQVLERIRRSASTATGLSRFKARSVEATAHPPEHRT